MLQPTHRLRIRRENSLKFVKDHELSIDFSDMIEKRIP